jgi:Tfp pilus assembly protein PilF
MGDLDRALGEFHIALKDKTNRTPEKIYLNIGHVYLEQGRHVEAIEAFEHAMLIRPNYVRAILGLGISYQRSGRNDLAAEEFREVVRLDPNSPEATHAKQMLQGEVKRDGP